MHISVMVTVGLKCNGSRSLHAIPNICSCKVVYVVARQKTNRTQTTFSHFSVFQVWMLVEYKKQQSNWLSEVSVSQNASANEMLNTARHNKYHKHNGKGNITSVLQRIKKDRLHLCVFLKNTLNAQSV